MDKTVTSLIAALAAVAAAAPSNAAPVATVHEALEFSSYADLLKPIPNAAAILKQAAEMDNATSPDGQANLENVQFYHHHHHHHHRYYHRRHHHHHHHRYY